MAPVFSRLFQITSGLWRTRKMNNLSLVPRRTMYPSMSSNVISGPPKKRISNFERLAFGVFFFACIFTTPVYILLHLDDYRTLNLAGTMGYVEPIEEIEEEEEVEAVEEGAAEVAEDEEDANNAIDEDEEESVVVQKNEEFCVLPLMELKSLSNEEEENEEDGKMKSV